MPETPQMDLPKRILVLDSGNSQVKWKTAQDEGSFSHAVHPLTDAEYSAIEKKEKGGMPIDYFRVNAQAYVVGELAERYSPTRLTGPERYTRDYYGVLLASTLLRAYKTRGELALFASHPTDDTDYEPDMEEACFGDWHIEHNSTRYTFQVGFTAYYDEPIGGYMNTILTDDGSHYAKPEVNGGNALIIDIGGGKTNFQAILPPELQTGATILDHSVELSIPVGIRRIEIAATVAIRHRYATEFRALKTLPIDRVRDAIKTGIFKGKGAEYPCHEEINDVTKDTIKQIIDVFNERASGPVRWDHIILTGGGAALLKPKLEPQLNHNRIILAESEDCMHLANVRGGMKFWRLARSEGLI